MDAGREVNVLGCISQLGFERAVMKGTTALENRRTEKLFSNVN